MRLALEQLFHKRPHFRDAGRAANEHDFVDLFGLQGSVLHGLLAGGNGAIDDGLNQLLELFADDFSLVAATTGQLDIQFGGWLRRERNLGFNHGLADGLHGLRVATQVKIHVAADVVESNRDQKVVDVVAAEVRVAVGGDDFEDAVVQFQNRNVKGAAAEVVDGNSAVLLLVQTVRKRGRRRLVDQSQHFEAGNAACVFRRLPLRVVEVCRHGNDGFGDGRGEVALRVALELAKNERGNFGRSERLLAQLNPQDFAGLQVVGKTERKELQLLLNVLNPAPHKAFDGIDGTLWSLNQVLAGGAADHRLIVFVERHHRGDKIQPILAGDYDRALPLHIGHQRVRGA